MKYHLSFDLALQKNTHSGVYIVIEGIDGSGKTTQVERVREHLEKQGKKVVVIGEPRKSSGLFGKLIEQILLSKVHVPPVALQYLFSADRAIHHEEVIIPALKEGKVVLSDRCFWSAVPYGIMDVMVGHGEKDYSFERAKVILSAQGILSMYHQFMVPDITFYLDVSVDTAMQRLSSAEKQKEIYEKKEKLEKIVLGYKWLIKEFPKEFVLIDGERSVEEVTKKIVSSIT